MRNKILIIILIILLIGGGLYYYYVKNNSQETVNESKEEVKQDLLEESNEIDSKFKDYKTYNITLDDEDVTISEKGIYNITGSLDGHNIIVNTEENVLLILDGVTINSSSPAIYIESAKNTYIKLVNDNNLECETTDELDACIYSKDDLFIYGNGSLNITSNKDGIASKDDLTIYSGTFNIDSSTDGIKGKDSVSILDGTFNIDAGESAIKTTNEDEKGDLTINGGTYKLSGTSNGIHAKGKLEINDGEFDISAEEALEATNIVINDGDINIKATDDGINATSKSNANTYAVQIEINGGNINIEMGQGDTDAIDSNGNLYIKGGNINITAQSPFDYDGTGELTGGTVTVNGEKISELTNQMMGGGNMQGNIPSEGNHRGGNQGTPPGRR